MLNSYYFIIQDFRHIIYMIKNFYGLQNNIIHNFQTILQQIRENSSHGSLISSIGNLEFKRHDTIVKVANMSLKNNLSRIEMVYID